MCYFLTVSFKKDFADFVVSSFNEKVVLRRNNNVFFQQNFGNDFVSMDITDGHCSCSIYQILMADSSADETEKLAKKYRNKGWSESKIQRALADNRRNQNEDLINLREILANIARHTGSLWLLAHQYSELTEHEALPGFKRHELKITELLDDKIGVPEGVIIKIK